MSGAPQPPRLVTPPAPEPLIWPGFQLAFFSVSTLPELDAARAEWTESEKTNFIDLIATALDQFQGIQVPEELALPPGITLLTRLRGHCGFDLPNPNLPSAAQLESRKYLKIIYARWIGKFDIGFNLPPVSNELKIKIKLKIMEGLKYCPLGLSERLGDLVAGMSKPQTLSEILCEIRWDLAKKMALKAAGTLQGAAAADQVHLHTHVTHVYQRTFELLRAGVNSPVELFQEETPISRFVQKSMTEQSFHFLFVINTVMAKFREECFFLDYIGLMAEGSGGYASDAYFKIDAYFKKILQGIIPNSGAGLYPNLNFFITRSFKDADEFDQIEILDIAWVTILKILIQKLLRENLVQVHVIDICHLKELFEDDIDWDDMGIHATETQSSIFSCQPIAIESFLANFTMPHKHLEDFLSRINFFEELTASSGEKTCRALWTRYIKSGASHPEFMSILLKKLVTRPEIQSLTPFTGFFAGLFHKEIEKRNWQSTLLFFKIFEEVQSQISGSLNEDKVRLFTFSIVKFRPEIPETVIVNFNLLLTMVRYSPAGITPLLKIIEKLSHLTIVTLFTTQDHEGETPLTLMLKTAPVHTVLETLAFIKTVLPSEFQTIILMQLNKTGCHALMVAILLLSNTVEGFLELIESFPLDIQIRIFMQVDDVAGNNILMMAILKNMVLEYTVIFLDIISTFPPRIQEKILSHSNRFGQNVFDLAIPRLEIISELLAAINDLAARHHSVMIKEILNQNTLVSLQNRLSPHLTITRTAETAEVLNIVVNLFALPDLLLLTSGQAPSERPIQYFFNCLLKIFSKSTQPDQSQILQAFYNLIKRYQVTLLELIAPHSLEFLTSELIRFFHVCGSNKNKGLVLYALAQLGSMSFEYKEKIKKNIAFKTQIFPCLCDFATSFPESPIDPLIQVIQESAITLQVWRAETLKPKRCSETSTSPAENLELTHSRPLKRQDSRPAAPPDASASAMAFAPRISAAVPNDDEFPDPFAFGLNGTWDGGELDLE